MKIACAGDNCIDYYDETGEAYPGGNAVNTAVFFRRFSVQSSYIGVIGDDCYGSLLLSALSAKGVDTSHVRRLPGNSALCHVTMENGERVLGDYDEGVMARFCPEDDMDFIAAHDLLLTGLWGHAEHILEEVRSRGVLTAFDAADRPDDTAARCALPHSDVFFFSDADSTLPVLRKKLEGLHAVSSGIVVATRGEKGSLAYDGHDFFAHGIVECEVVDTMGAGDSYIAGFLYALLSKCPIPECMEAGAKNASLTIGYRGAW